MPYDEARKPNIAQTRPTDPGMVVYRTGAHAHTMSRGEGIRKFLPFRVTLECQLTPIAETNEIFEFYLYQEDAAGAIKIAGQLLKAWFQRKRVPYDRYPKPMGHGEARRIEDREFISRYQEAQNKSKDVLVSGDRNDPVAYVLTRPKNLIIIPGKAVVKALVKPANRPRP